MSRLFENAAAFPSDAPAVEDADGRATYAELLERSASAARFLLRFFECSDLAERRVAFLCPPGAQYAAVQWGIWRAGGVAVPLGLTHPPAELEYAARDSQASALIAGVEEAARLNSAAQNINRPLLTAPLPDAPPGSLPRLPSERRAMILYTSGTTGRPKGVVSTHGNLDAQTRCLVEAWEWSPADRMLHALPLHHIHGVVNGLTCALYSGAACEFLPRFDADAVWERLAEGGVSVFMGVPTMYSRLIQAWEAAPMEKRAVWSKAAGRLRLAVSGSAALPVSLFEKWRALSGQALLERYGMTEFGMALSNPYRGERLPGTVGFPLPGMEARLTPAGEIETRGEAVFLEYWNRPKESAEALQDGWFRTGDIAVKDESGRFRILGRRSVDIVKTGGYKVSALEVENALMELPQIQECAVVGLPDEEWGERVCAAAVLKNGAELNLKTLRNLAKERLAVYKAPSRLLVVKALPRNAMGKVMKPEVKRLFERIEETVGRSA